MPGEIYPIRDKFRLARESASRRRLESRATPGLPIDADVVETYMTYIKRLAQSIETKANILGFYVDRYNARRDCPKKATALDLCDDAILRLDTLRDIIDRAIDGDESVYCSEANANEITKRINWAIEHIQDASTFARDKEAQAR